MTSIFDQASSLFKPYTDAGYTLTGRTEWTGVAAGSATAGMFDLTGGFALAKKSSGSLLLIATDLNYRTSLVPAKDSVMQTYLQFRDWDNQSKPDVPSWLNLVCNL